MKASQGTKLVLICMDLFKEMRHPFLHPYTLKKLFTFLFSAIQGWMACYGLNHIIKKEMDVVFIL